ncbi:MAG: hypothetical protein M0R46_18110, partial [Candidatus Muirbacterium halophilum]|nr:hypothetical protein [Candidatus Muirbacterium halophilum]
DFVKKAKEIYIETVKVQIEPVIEEMKEGEKKQLTASLVYKDGTLVDMSGLENIQWNWSITGNEDDSYKIEPIRTNSTQADFTLYKGNFMDIIISAKVDFSVAEKRWVRLNSAGVKEGSAQTRVVSREFSIEGDNQVPIMIVNEDDRRIKNIPMINPHNLEGIGMGESPYAGDLLHLSLKFLSEYTDNKADEIEAMILDPHYSLSHHVILKETGNDSRIFATEIPEVNLDDDPDNDVAYDSFEVKINYPLPYPQIIQSVGESRSRILADSCEIEYVKKNGEIINDLDDDGEIQEKERLNFPVWQGPDYEENEVKPYYISNMVYNQEDVKSLDQTQFIAKNSKYRIKVIDKKDRGERILVEMLSGAWHKLLELFKEKENIYYSDMFYCVPEEYSDDKVEIKGLKYGVIKVDNSEELNLFIVKYQNFDKFMRVKEPIIVVNSNHSQGQPEKFNEYIVSILVNKYNLNVIYDKSLLKSELFDYLKKGNSFYFTGHGKLKNKNQNFYGFSLEGNDINESEINNLFIDFKEIETTGKKFDMVFFNCCGSGLLPGVQEINRIFNPRILFGWDSYISINTGDPFLFGATIFKVGIEPQNENIKVLDLIEKTKKELINTGQCACVDNFLILRGENEIFYKQK